MRKILPILFILLLILSGCGGTTAEPLYTVQDAAFTCTPQELIDHLNDRVAASSSDDLLIIPAYEKSGEEIFIGGSGLTLRLYETSSGHLSKIELYWASGAYGKRENLTSAGFYVGVLLNAFSPQNAKEIDKQMSSVMDGKLSEMEISKDDITFYFWTYGSSGNKLKIYPS